MIKENCRDLNGLKQMNINAVKRLFNLSELERE